MCKILIAEQKPAERRTLRKLLEQSLGPEHPVLEAGTGSEVLSLYEQLHPKLLLLDVELPGISGLEAARRIRARGESCAIVFLSSCDSFAYAREAISLRAQDFLLKPCTAEELIPSVVEAIGLYCGEWEVPQLQGTLPEHESARLNYIRERIEAFIGDHYHSNLTLQKVAQAMNYSGSHFCRLFKKCFQVNFSVYLTALRVERAKERLDGSMDTVKEIGAACGYTDTSYFIRVFKRLTGLTPSEYRIMGGEDRKKVP